MKWEYLIWDDMGKADNHQRRMDVLGQRGWELVTIIFNHGNPVTAYFKRRLELNEGANL